MAVIYFGSSANNLIEIKAPVEMSGSHSDLDSSSTTRTASGQMTRSIVRGGDKNIRKLSLKWELISLAEASFILQTVKSAFFYVKYMDVQAGGWRTAQFYAGDREYTVRRMRGDLLVVEDLSFNIIER